MSLSLRVKQQQSEETKSMIWLSVLHFFYYYYYLWNLRLLIPIHLKTNIACLNQLNFYEFSLYSLFALMSFLFLLLKLQCLQVLQNKSKKSFFFKQNGQLPSHLSNSLITFKLCWLPALTREVTYIMIMLRCISSNRKIYLSYLRPWEKEIVLSFKQDNISFLGDSFVELERRAMI